MNTEREKFEAWFVRNIPGDVRDNALLALRQSEREDGNYTQPIMQAFWEGWQARAASPQATAGPMNGIPATLRHGEGAIARCFYCGRYSLDPKTLSDRQPKCECGQKHGWSGSFKKPGPDAKWSGAAPVSPEATATDEQIEQRADEACSANGYGVEDGTGVAHSHWWTFDRDGLRKFARCLTSAGAA